MKVDEEKEDSKEEAKEEEEKPAEEEKEKEEKMETQTPETETKEEPDEEPEVNLILWKDKKYQFISRKQNQRKHLCSTLPTVALPSSTRFGRLKRMPL